jgi:peptidoglycan/xylan/chitin deacetylase (PgdA/CDA1 family)
MGRHNLMRLDRFLTLHISLPLSGFFRTSRDLTIPVLMYHSIAEDVDESVPRYFRTVTTPETFERHMGFLQGMSQPRPLGSLAPHLADSLMSPRSIRRPVVVTFDDGFRDFYTTAFPILERFGFRATVFLASGFMGKTFLTGRECLRVGEVRELAEKGIEFGSHTITHPKLTELSRGKITEELVGSKNMIQNIVGSEVSLFSYPYRFPAEDAQFTRKLGALLLQHGYSAGVTTAIGMSRASDDPLFLRRLPINDTDDRQFFQAKLEGAYDWLHMGQLMHKRLRATFRGWKPL